MNVQRKIGPRPDESPLQPIVDRPPAGLPGAIIAAVAGIAAIILFFILDSSRRDGAARTAVRNEETAFAAAPALAVPPEPVAQQTVPMVMVPQRAPMAATAPGPAVVSHPLPRSSPPDVAYPPPPSSSLPPMAQPPPFTAPQAQPPVPAMDEPALVIDSGAGASRAAGGEAGVGSTDDGTRLGRLVRAANPGSTIAMGTLIPAVLETPIDTSKPGVVRAIVSKDVRGIDGRRVLVPRGSKLIGEYQSDIAWTQRRVSVTWTSLVRPDNSTITLAFPAADPLGGSGVPGRMGGSGLGQFLGGILQSAFTAGESLLTQRISNTVIVGVTPGVGAGATPGTLISTGGRRKLTVERGALVNVFVSRDLDLSEGPS